MTIENELVSKDQAENLEAENLPRRVGPYRLEEVLGKGGMGTVYKAYDEKRQRRVALKRIRTDIACKAVARARFRREARTASQLDHPGIVKVFGIFAAEGSDWIVMELVDGQRLDQLLKSGSLDLDQVHALGIEIASAVAAAHAKGVVHRDLKASNILITKEGHAKILDFGLAKQVLCSTGESSISMFGQLLGTPHSMSPEQAMGLDVDLRSDLFSLGSLLYLMLTGVSPFVGASALKTLKNVCTLRQPRACDVKEEVPRRLSDVVDRLLEKDPAHRPGQASDVVSALRRGALPRESRSSSPDTTPTICFDGAVTAQALASPPRSGRGGEVSALFC